MIIKEFVKKNLVLETCIRPRKCKMCGKKLKIEDHVVRMYYASYCKDCILDIAFDTLPDDLFSSKAKANVFGRRL